MAAPVSVSRDGLDDAPDFFAVAANKVLHIHTVGDTNVFVRDEDEEIWLRGQIPHHNSSQLIGNFAEYYGRPLSSPPMKLNEGGAGKSERWPGLMYHTDLYDKNSVAEKR
jgi:hypothetical protein